MISKIISATNEAETSSSGGYVKGGTKPGTATITVTREDKKESFSFTVVNVVPTTSIEIYHQVKGKQQVLGNSLCILTGKSDTVRLQTVPGINHGIGRKGYMDFFRQFQSQRKSKRNIQ